MLDNQRVKYRANMDIYEKSMGKYGNIDETPVKIIE